ncbi:MAG: M23 family metallopeptidase [bacterium]
MRNYSPLSGHPGVDFACDEFTPVVASADGKVIVRENNVSGGFGCSVRIDHGFGMTIYAHFNAFKVNLGDQVKMGQVIGLSGGMPGNPCAGSSGGPHLHWGLKLNGVRNSAFADWVDPMPYMVESIPSPIKVEYVDQKLLLRKGWHETFRVRFRNVSGENMSDVGLYIRKDPGVTAKGLNPNPPGIDGGSVLRATSWPSDKCAATFSGELKPGEVGEFILDLFASEYTQPGQRYREDFGIAHNNSKEWFENFNVWFEIEVV